MWRGRTETSDAADGQEVHEALVEADKADNPDVPDVADKTKFIEDTGTIGESVVAGNENGSGTPGDRRQAGRNEVPSYAPTDPGWVTDDFSSLDLGEDVDLSPRPVRRLDLPPLGDATPMAGEPSPSARDLGDPMERPPSGQPSGLQSNDLGVFGAVNKAVRHPAEDSTSDVTRQNHGIDPVGAPQFGSTQLSSEPSGLPKQGVPPHPLSGGGSDMAGLSDDRNQLRAGPPAGMGSEGDPFGGYGPSDRAFEEQFSHNDGLGPQSRPDRSGRPNLALAPIMNVEQQKRRWALPLVGLLAVLGLAAGYFFLIRDGSDSADTFAQDENDPASDLVEEDLEPEGATADATDDTDSTDAMADDAAEDATATPLASELADNPVLSLSGAGEGPLATETEYEMEIDGVPEGAEYLVIVDDLPQEPALSYLPVLILPEGRHSLEVAVTAGAKTATTNPVDVYVLAPSLTATHRANLSSVSIADEGWSEAMRQFDEFRAAGHDGLMLSPSDPYPSLLPGFWNLYVPGFADVAEAQAYCEGAGLAIPDACFPAPFDPNGPARDS